MFNDYEIESWIFEKQREIEKYKEYCTEYKNTDYYKNKVDEFEQQIKALETFPKEHVPGLIVILNIFAKHLVENMTLKGKIDF